jgi:hypothetical protein
MLMPGSCDLILALLAATACAAVLGCRPHGGDRPVVVVVSGDTAGWIVPCGCTSNQSGGLPRRAAYVEQLRATAEVVLLDAGGAAHGASPYDRAKFEAVLQGESLMGVAAHNIGASEALFGAEPLRRMAQGCQPPVSLVSANVRDANGALVAEPVRLIAAAGRRLAVVGVLAERYAAAGLRIAPPRQAVLEALRGVAGRYDAALVLAYLPEDELRQLAESLPEVDAVVGGPTGQPIPPQPKGPTLLTSATNKGKFLVRLDMPARGTTERWKGGIVELNDSLADNAEQVVNVEYFRRRLAQQDFAPSQTSFAAPLPPHVPKGFAVAGNDSCKKCHEDDCRQWRHSKHAEAWRALKEKAAHVDPECQRCHTTGYGQPGGFASWKDAAAPRDRAGVGCESCHGPSLAHVIDTAVHTPHYAAAKNHCTACHDRENSPRFDYDKYWEKIKHGEPAQEEKK